MSIHVIANPKAGRGLAALEALLARRDDIVVHRTEALDRVEALVGELRRDASRLIFAGGDGTFHLASEFLSDGKTPNLTVGFIPTGTGGDFMRSVGPSRSLEEHLDVAIQAPGRPFRPGLVEADDGLASFTNVASLGVSAEVAWAVEGGLKRLGTFGYTIAMIQGILSYRSKPMRVLVDGELLMEGRGYLTAIGCAQYFGGAKRITPLAEPFGDRVHVVAVRDDGVFTTLMATRKLRDGSHIELPIVEHALGHEVVIEGDGLRSELDGELGPLGSLKIRRGPVAFQLATAP